MRLIPTAFTQRNIDPADPTGGQTIDALRLRQKMLQENKPSTPAQIASPWQGAAFMANSLVNNLQEKEAAAQEAAGRKQLAGLMSSIDMTAGPSSDQLAQIGALDPDMQTKLFADAMAQRRADAEYKRNRADTVTDREDTQAFELEKAGLTTGNKATKDSFSMEQDLRKEYQALPIIKNFPVVQTGLERMQSGAADDSPVGDIALIYGFMKLQDPDSVVREGEYATAQNAAGIPDRVMNLYNQAIRGVRLTPEQRSEFLRVGMGQYKNLSAQVAEQNNRYNAIAKNYSIDPTRVTVLPKVFEEQQAQQQDGAPAGGTGQPTQSAPAAQAAGQPPNAQGDLVVPTEAIEYLQAHPDTAATFDETFKAPGLAAKYLKMRPAPAPRVVQ